ncbi:MAG: hypothetical protein ACI85O_003319 [Saprospiraceae bacterium]|jgi:hypothetical protein
MKNLRFLPFLAIVATLFFQSCVKDSCEKMTTWVQTTAIYKTQAEMDAVQVSNEATRALKKPGKIYFYNDFIFINEIREGVHIIDNTDPTSPQNIGFINIEGNADIAIKDGRLYADSYTTLFILDVSDVNNVSVIDRQSTIFNPGWETGEGLIWVYNETETITEMVDCETRDAMVNRGGIFFRNFDDVALIESSVGGSGGGSGTGGSMARFTLVGDYLYSVGQSDMRVFSLSNPDSPTLANTVNLGWGIETIIPHEDKLFIGSTSGMQIWDNQNPEQPTFLAEFSHAGACDPVFVKDNFAYVTLRDGNLCQGFVNQLDLIDISNITSPTLEKTFQMDNPHGLSIDGDNLFLCEGTHGLKVFDIEDPEKLGNKKIDHIKDISAYDVIAVPGESDVLLMVGEGGFFQYDYSNPSNLKEISRILVE